VLITDYCCGMKVPWSKQFADYVSRRGYHLLPVDQYAQVIVSRRFMIALGLSKVSK